MKDIEPRIIKGFKDKMSKATNKGAIATAYIENGEPVIYVWKPKKFDIHSLEHEKYHLKHHMEDRSNLTIQKYMKNEVEAERGVNKKLHNDDRLTPYQASTLANSLYKMLNAQTSKKMPYDVFLNMAVDEGWLKGIGLRPKEIKIALDVEKEGERQKHDYNVEAMNIRTGQRVRSVVGVNAKNDWDAKALIQEDIEHNHVIDKQKDWKVVSVVRAKFPNNLSNKSRGTFRKKHYLSRIGKVR